MLLLEDEDQAEPNAAIAPGDCPFGIKATARARRIIFSNCSTELQAGLIQFQSATEMWNFLYRKFSGKNVARKNQGIKKLATFRFSKPTVQENILELTNLISTTEVAAGTKDISIEELGVHMLLNCLPSRFHGVRSVLESKDVELTLADVTASLVAEEDRQLSREDPLDFAGALTGNRKCPHNRPVARCWTCDPSKHPSKAKCKDCGSNGHFSKGSEKCAKHKENAPDGVVGSAKRSSEDDSFSEQKEPPKFAKYSQELGKNDLRRSIKGKACMVSNNKDPEVFVLDSGCTQSILMNKDLLTNFRSHRANFMTADAGNLSCIGIGDLFINPNLTLTDVLYCPSISLNLISVSQICQQGFTVQTSKASTLVLKDRKTVLSALQSEGLYVFKIQPVATQRALATTSSHTELFHKRMGHLNLKSLRLLSHLAQGIVLDKDPEVLCEPCTMAKAHRNPFPPSDSLSKKIGELTHVDLCHIGAPDLDGNIMFMIMTDDASRFSTIYLLRHKDDAEEFMKSYDRKILVKTGRHCQVIRSDNGGEFFSNSIADYCNTHGISQESSTAYTPEQNGRAERINRTVLEGTSAMLYDADLPFEYWGLAAQCFVYLKNRSPHHALFRSTPYTEWNERLPDLTNVRVFGCICYVYIPSETRKKQGLGNKLQPKALKMIFVGYSDKHKAWKTIDPNTKNIVVSSNVIFDDEMKLRNHTNSQTLLEYVGAETTAVDSGEASVSLDQGGNHQSSSSDPIETNAHGLSNSNHQEPAHPDGGVRNTITIAPSIPNGTQQEPTHPDGGVRNTSSLPESNQPSVARVGQYEVDKAYKSATHGKWKYVDPNNRTLKWDPSNLPEAGSKRRRDPPSNNAFASIMSCFDTTPLLSTLDICDAFYNVPLDQFAFAVSAKPTNDSNPTFQQAMKGPHKELWENAIKEEYKSLKEKGVFSKPCQLPAGYKVLDTKIVLKLKEPEGPNSARRYKARLCARGFRQEEGVDFEFTFAPVATYHALRLFLSIMASLDYEIHTVDVKTAFLHSVLKEIIFVGIPDGFPNAHELREKGLVLQLYKCLYGLKQSPMEWNSDLDLFLRSLGFIPCETEPCVYVHKERKQYLLIYVDDIIVATKSLLEMKLLKKTIDERFPISDKGEISKFLNMDVFRDRILFTIYICQSTKIENVLEDARLSEEDLKLVRVPSKLPACPSNRLQLNEGEAVEKPYKGILGQALHIAITCRPDIITAVSMCGRYAKNPSYDHWRALLRILSYLNGTREKVLRLGGKFTDMKLTAYSDSDWAGDLDERRSRSGYLILMNCSPIIWASKLQVSVALSSTEAEYVALSLASRDVIWIRNLLLEFGFNQEDPTTIFEDNQSCIKIAISTKQLPGTKHIDIRHHFIRQKIASGEIKLESIGTQNMIADIFTKSLPNESFDRHIMAIGVAPLRGSVGV